MDPFFKVYRDDSLGVTFDSPEIVPKILDYTVDLPNLPSLSPTSGSLQSLSTSGILGL